LQALGRWTRVNGEAIYGTSASPFAKLPWGRCTQKTGKLYLHVFDWPRDGKLIVPGLKSTVRAARLMSGGQALRVDSRGSDLRIDLPRTAPDPVVSVIEVELSGPLVVDNSLPRPAADGTVRLPLWMADIHNPGYGAEAHLGEDSGAPAIVNWTDHRTRLTWALEITAPGNYEVVATFGPSQPGAQVRLQIGKEAVNAKIPTGGQPVVLGNLSIPAGGVHELNLRPIQAGWQPLTVRAVMLRPAATSRVPRSGHAP
jgi:alpha-L-fucosidase